ncbi:hypothetical protein [Cognatilysobacter lacus]|uniref:hypothetical protein n=1 Tax=Cognatilysobacter lacus TaxID=1643323 RepID=UPI00195F6EEA|nr:hypothetical protein [Lysobacter lacus]
MSIAWVMAAQALSRVAKDLNKTSAKSSSKLLVPGDQQAVLFRWVAALTGSKSALKGVGFFLAMRCWRRSGFAAPSRSWRQRWPSCLRQACCGSAAIWNALRRSRSFANCCRKAAQSTFSSGARLCVFGAREVWFVIALPVFL